MRADVKQGYTRTTVGVIPEDWKVVAAADVVEPSAPICYGVVQVGRNVDGGVPIVPIKFVKEIAWATLHRTSPHLEKPYLRSRVKAGDVLISVKGTIGRVGIVPLGFDGNISRELARLRPRQGYLTEYVAYQFEADSTQRRISKSVVGTTRLEFSIATLRQFELPIPASLIEQREIVAVLSEVDGLLAGLDRLIVKKRDLRQAVMQQLLTGRSRLSPFGEEGTVFSRSDIGALPVEWQAEKVINLAKVSTGSCDTQDRVEDGAYPFFVRSATVERINSYSFDGEAVLTAGDGVGTGKVFHYIQGKFNLHQRVYKISGFCPSLNGKFFFLVFSARFYDRIMSLTAKSSVDSVRREMIAGMMIPLPPIEEQEAIAAALFDMDSELVSLESRRDKTRALKQAMMQELLTGRIRLI